MSSDEPITVLFPPARSKEARENRRRLAPVVRQVVTHAATVGSDDLLTEVYLAGLWHGAELQRLRIGAKP